MDGRVTFLGHPLDALTFDETVERLVELIEGGRFAQHVVLNAGKIVMLADDPALAEVVDRCDLVSADGQSIVWAGRFLGLDVPERVAGIDLMEALLVRAELSGARVYFLGARRDVLDTFMGVVHERFPALVVAGDHDGYFDDEEAMADAVRASGAQLLFVAMSSPRKEMFLHRMRDRLGPLVAVGVGGSFDVWAGVTTRAPRWMQRAGLEWFYRLIQEPGRMWRRYLVGNSRFITLVLSERFRSRS